MRVSRRMITACTPHTETSVLQRYVSSTVLRVRGPLWPENQLPALPHSETGEPCLKKNTCNNTDVSALPHCRRVPLGEEAPFRTTATHLCWYCASVPYTVAVVVRKCGRPAIESNVSVRFRRLRFLQYYLVVHVKSIRNAYMLEPYCTPLKFDLHTCADYRSSATAPTIPTNTLSKSASQNSPKSIIFNAGDITVSYLPAFAHAHSAQEMVRPFL